MTSTSQPQQKLQSPGIFQNQSGTFTLTNKRIFWKTDKADKPSLNLSLVEIDKLYVSVKTAQRVKLEYFDKKTNQNLSGTLELTSKNAKNIVSKFREDWLFAKRTAPNAISPASGASSPLPIRKPAPPISKEEINQRLALLSRNADLAALHQELVVGNKISEEDFWEPRQNLLRDQKAKDAQKRGRSSKVPDLQPTTEESGEMKIKITPQTIDNIFEQYPSIKKAYTQKVPHEISSEDFWRGFYASKYFHRNRTGIKQNGSKDDLFDSCFQEDEEELIHGPKRLKTDHIFSLMDLSATQEDHGETGIAPDITMRPGHGKSLPILRQFNRHGERILKSIGAGSKSRTENHKQDILMEELDEVKKAEKKKLAIEDQTKYFQSYITPENSNRDEITQIEEQSRKQILRDMSSKIAQWEPDLKSLPLGQNLESQVNSILNKRIKAKNMKKASMTNSAFDLSPDIETQVQNIHSTGKEFLRHYWATRGQSAPEKKEKNGKMYEQIKMMLERIDKLLENAGEQNDRVQSMLTPFTNSLKHAASDFEKANTNNGKRKQQ
ncbi:hypothetical protein G9A89_014943 [Geosiphon pyriformis]|nr:hypothetical protein G9A89_014943 [Geosiphon pyriformis]